MDVTHCFPPAALKSCFECAAPCDGTLTAEDEMSGTDVPVCVTCHPMLTLVSEDDQPAEGTPAYALTALQYAWENDCQPTEAGQARADTLYGAAHDALSALAGNIDPNQPGHGDMTRCTPGAPCRDAGCEFCTADAEWHERYPVEDMDSAPQITEDGCPTPGRCSDAYDDFSLCAPMFPTAVLRQTFHGTAGMTPEDWTSVVRPAVPTHYAHHYTRG
jgi:hypothetical protein